jgi:hypothetical protein
LDIAIRENIQKVVFVHHDPNSSDESIRLADEKVREYHRKLKELAERNGTRLNPVDWEFGREGMLIFV